MAELYYQPDDKSDSESDGGSNGHSDIKSECRPDVAYSSITPYIDWSAQDLAELQRIISTQISAFQSGDGDKALALQVLISKPNLAPHRTS